MSIRKAFAWTLAGQAVSLLSLLIALVWLSRILSPAEMGAFATGQAVNGILAALGAIGLGAFIIREQAIDDDTLGSAFAINFIMAATLSTAAYVGASAVAALVGDPRIGEIVRWIALVPLLAAFEMVPQAMLQRQMRFGAFAIVLALRAVTVTTVAIGTALFGDRFLCAAYALPAGAAISVIASNIAAPGHLAIRPRLTRWRPLARFGLQILMVGGIGILSMRASELAMASILGLAALGIFSRASTVFNTIYVNLYGAIGRVLMARLAQDLRGHGQLRDTYAAGLHATLGLMWPALLGIALLTGPIVRLAFGPQWMEAALPLAILMVAQAIAMTFGLSYELFILRDQVGRQARYEAIRAIAGFAFFVIGCAFGLTGAAFGRLLEIALAAAFYIPAILKLSELRALDYSRILALNAMVTLPALLPTVLLVAVYGFGTGSGDGAPLPLVAASVTAGFAGWLGALFVFAHPLASDIQRLAVRVLGLAGRREA